MDRPLAPPVADSRLSRALSASACGTLLLVVPVRLDEMAALLGAALRETVLQAAARQLEPVLRTLLPAAGAELHRRGDGFLVVLGDPPPERVDAAVRMLLDALDMPVEVAGQRFCLGGCVGRVEFDAQSGHEATTLLRQADLASLEARRLGRGHSVRHEAATTMMAMRRLRAEDTLHRGIDQIRLDLLFEIQADMCTGALTGAVALPRWTPALGTGSTADSVRGWTAVAADAGLTHRLTLMLLHGICRQVRQWRDQGLDVPSLSVDLPPGLWQDRTLVPMVLDALVDQGLPGGTLTLLMPGQALSGDPDLLRSMLRSLRATGVRIGLARLGDAVPVSLDTLGRLPLDELTLDARVLERLGQRDGTRMAAALVGLGRALGLRVVAEGVRSDEQLDVLRARHCDEFQGPLLSLPVGATTMTQVLMHARVQHRVVLDSATGTSTGTGSSAPSESTRSPAHRTGRVSITAAAG
ncbi:MAG: hypothetical protein RL654_1918 [Pseudomonadota bacterium]|jgi:EAL domain-containing protein (putative c-di-GMP-specific phosphodiesterase class I)/GGDEF domain-containing protein